jgi:hypothetical protein
MWAEIVAPSGYGAAESRAPLQNKAAKQEPSRLFSELLRNSPYRGDPIVPDLFFASDNIAPMASDL